MRIVYGYGRSMWPCQRHPPSPLYKHTHTRTSPLYSYKLTHPRGTCRRSRGPSSPPPSGPRRRSPCLFGVLGGSASLLLGLLLRCLGLRRHTCVCTNREIEIVTRTGGVDPAGRHARDVLDQLRLGCCRLCVLSGGRSASATHQSFTATYTTPRTPPNVNKYTTQRTNSRVAHQNDVDVPADAHPVGEAAEGRADQLQEQRLFHVQVTVDLFCFCWFFGVWWRFEGEGVVGRVGDWSSAGGGAVRGDKEYPTPHIYIQPRIHTSGAMERARRS